MATGTMTSKFVRPDGRAYGQLRPIRIKVGVAKFAEGSAYIEYGDTQVLCTASLEEPVPRHVAAISAGIVKGERLLDLAYAEDSQADADMNVVATDGGSLVEVQGTAEGLAFTKADLDALLEMALGGINKLVEAQKEA